MAELNTVIVGGGHCGLNLACWLEEQGEGRSYVVLERATILDKWKTCRWDAFQVNTPQFFSRLHGQTDDVADDAKGRPLKNDIALWEAHVKTMGVKVRESCEVVSVTRRDDGKFVTEVRSTDGGPEQYISSNVVACNGNYDHVKIPDCSNALDRSVKQVASENFKNPEEFNAGAVLIVGGGQSGVQLADVCQQSGRKVFLCTSRVPGSVRNYRGEDVFYWLDRIGFSHLTKEALKEMPPEMAMGLRYGRIPITGAVKPISYFSLHRAGVTILGGLDSVADEGRSITLKDNRPENVRGTLASYRELPAQCEAWIEANGKGDDFKTNPGHLEPEWAPEEELLEETGPLSLSLVEENITNVLWATGYSADFSWIKIDAVHDGMDPVDHKPSNLETSVPGFYFSGFHWLNTLQSGNLLGFDADHEILLAKLRD